MSELGCALESLTAVGPLTCNRRESTQGERPVYVRSLMNVGYICGERGRDDQDRHSTTHTKPLASRGQLDPSVAIIASGPSQRTTSGQAHGSARQASAFPRTLVTRRQADRQRAREPSWRRYSGMRPTDFQPTGPSDFLMSRMRRRWRWSSFPERGEERYPTRGASVDSSHSTSSTALPSRISA